ncbi:NADH-quinone oxidoreductase subunit J, partial [Streptomyces sp. DSM 41529]|nr:NADH-quinone oxidoreductase subunit J [Streptomyces sp. DSM 41529]
MTLPAPSLLATAAATTGHPGFLSPTGVEIAFVLVGLATLGAAVITVTT